MQFALLAAVATLLSPTPIIATNPPVPTHHAVAVHRALDDATIVAIYDAANTADIETGMLGARKGTTRQIREYGAMLVKAHTDARRQGRDLAKKLGVTPTPPAGDQSAAQHAAAMKQLRSLHGHAFDHAFLEHEIAYHKAVIAAVQGTLLPAIKNPDLKALVIRVAPVFVQHQQAAELLLAKLAK